jgi:hypothetical protein
MTESTHMPIHPIAAFLRIAGAGALTTIVLLALGYAPTAALGGRSAVEAMLIGGGVSLLGGWIGCIPPIAMINAPPAHLMSGLMLGIGARFLLSLGLALALSAYDVAPRVPLLLWVAIVQIAVLTVDTVGLLRLVRRPPGAAT